ncbi:hypothetical protein EYF80_011387 [Liparis tanakae]|uniref:Uncharacterized protein n=1 Tax=Liparis tanakae TaxID=230148 RepID=A0A4Z2IMM1_9TELE|nr:hypothetical protein EYF80_011387 [Liparis tanakae]
MRDSKQLDSRGPGMKVLLLQWKQECDGADMCDGADIAQTSECSPAKGVLPPAGGLPPSFLEWLSQGPRQCLPCLGLTSGMYSIFASYALL